MKVNFFLDIGYYSRKQLNEFGLTATTSPMQKIDGDKRMKFTLDIPDKYFDGEVDAVVPIEEFKLVDEKLEEQ